MNNSSSRPTSSLPPTSPSGSSRFYSASCRDCGTAALLKSDDSQFCGRCGGGMVRSNDEVTKKTFSSSDHDLKKAGR